MVFIKISGQFSFNDPLPAQTFLFSLTARLYGRFNCQNDTQGAPYVCLLGNVFVDFGYFNTSYKGCSCPNCVNSVQFTSPDEVFGWSGYVYGGVNTFYLFVSSNEICLSRIDLSLVAYRQTFIENIHPFAGPLGFPTSIDLNGYGFLENKTYSCNFTSLTNKNIMINATYVNDTILTCLTTAAFDVGKYNLYIYRKNNENVYERISDEFVFTIYGEKKKKKI